MNKKLIIISVCIVVLVGLVLVVKSIPPNYNNMAKVLIEDLGYYCTSEVECSQKETYVLDKNVELPETAMSSYFGDDENFKAMEYDLYSSPYQSITVNFDEDGNLDNISSVIDYLDTHLQFTYNYDHKYEENSYYSCGSQELNGKECTDYLQSNVQENEVFDGYINNIKELDDSFPKLNILNI